MSFLDRFKKKKEEPEPIVPERPLPSELESFRRETIPVPERPAPFGRPPAEPLPRPEPIPARNVDKLDLILEKLETIDQRLKLIEEKLSKI